MFHLFTHAFFKALLFLAAGSVMHSMGDVIDMRRFGGLRRALPITHWTFLCGAAALAGVPLLVRLLEQGRNPRRAVRRGAARTARRRLLRRSSVIAAFTALLTAFYTFRAYFMTFWGEERFPEEAGHHPHDAPPVMAWPLRILAVCAVFVGVAVGPTHWFADYLHHAVGPGRRRTSTASKLALIGAQRGRSSWSASALAWLMYVRSPELPGEGCGRDGAAVPGVAQQVLFRRDFLGDPGRAAARRWPGSSSWFDRSDHRSDRRWRGRWCRVCSSGVPLWVHNGLVPSYALVMWVGLLVCVLFAMRLLAVLSLR